MSNKYLEKIAGFPGSFLTAAKKDAVKSIVSNDTKSVWSGLNSGPTVASSRKSNFSPRVVQNRTGLNRSALNNTMTRTKPL